jgi:catechol 2,3-dioxygenase-like lactoylglutathione lyase family enzyme
MLTRQHFLAAAVCAAAVRGKPARSEEPMERGGDGSNPLNVRLIAVTITVPALDAAIKFYRSGFDLDEVRTGTLTVAKAERPYCLLRPRGPGPMVRLIEAPAGEPIRPRHPLQPLDPGLAMVECAARDIRESYARLMSLGAKAISAPRSCALPSNRAGGTSVTITAYTALGPGGEKFLVSSKVAGNTDARAPLHSAIRSAILIAQDQAAVDSFYDAALGLKRIGLRRTAAGSCNEVMGAAADAQFDWGRLGHGSSIEAHTFLRSNGITRPCDLGQSGLAMITLAVGQLDAVRRRAPMPSQTSTALTPGLLFGNRGMVLRGAVGELIEVVEDQGSSP